MNNPKSANKFIFFFLIYSILLQITLSLFLVIFNIKSFDSFLYIQDFVLILIPVMLYLFFTKRKFTDIIPLNKLNFKNILYVILITIFSYPVISFVSYVTSIFVTTTINDEITQYLCKYSIFEGLIIFTLLPAFFEELVCRGLIMSNYKTTSPIIMYVLSGIAFGIIHLNFQQMSYAIVAGIMLAFIVHYTNSIFASMLSHFLINGSQVVMAKILMNTGVDFASQQAQVEALDSKSEFLYLFITTLIFGSILYYIIRKFIAYNRLNAESYINNESGTNKKCIDIYLVLSIVIFLIFSIGTEYLAK